MDHRPRTRRSYPLALAIACLASAAGGSRAATHAPPPARPVSASMFSGRWYEIARTPNRTQKDCEGPTTDFVGFDGAGLFQVVETCHQGAPGGPVKAMRVKARILHPPDYTRFRMSFLGGLVHQEYWILDHADDDSWALMGTPGGNYVWLLARRPSLPPRALSGALARLNALGYETSRLVYPAQGGPAVPAPLTGDRIAAAPGG